MGVGEGKMECVILCRRQRGGGDWNVCLGEGQDGGDGNVPLGLVGMGEMEVAFVRMGIGPTERFDG